MKHSKYDMLKIEALAIEFREALEAVHNAGGFDYHIVMRDFPHGCCGEVSDLLGQYLVDNGIEHLWYVRGDHYPDTGDDEADFSGKQSHAWISVGTPFDDYGIIVDLTGDQRAFSTDREYDYYNVPVYVGRSGWFHGLFDIKERDCHEFHGLRDYDDGAYWDMLRLYQRIMDKLR